MAFALFAGIFALTAAVEGAVVGVWFRAKRYVYYSLLCNLLTNPALNLLLYFVVTVWGIKAYTPVLAALELAVLGIEAFVWRYLTSFTWQKAFAVSFVTNAVSFFVGILLSALSK